PVLESSYDEPHVMHARQHRPSGWSEPVAGGQLRVLGRQELRQVHHDATLLPGRVVLHLALEHQYAAPVGHRLENARRELDLVDGRAEDPLGDVDLARMERPRTDTAEEEGGAELVLAAERVGDVTEGAVEGQGTRRRARVDHARDRVVPRILLRGRAWR